jgi:nucleosome binding factor SPN SPT16 subunit
LRKDKQEGAVVDEWAKQTATEKTVDVTAGISVILAAKDATEQKNMRRAAKITSEVFENILIDRVEDIIDKGKPIKQSELASEIEKKILSGTIVKNEPIDRCYTPIIQSGGEYDLRPNAFSTDNALTFDTIICSLGIRYRNYCSNIARTLIINQTPEQEANYDFLCTLQEAAIAAMLPGSRLSDVHQAITSFVAEKRPDLSEHLAKNCGFGVSSSSSLLSVF